MEYTEQKKIKKKTLVKQVISREFLNLETDLFWAVSSLLVFKKIIFNVKFFLFFRNSFPVDLWKEENWMKKKIKLRQNCTIFTWFWISVSVGLTLGYTKRRFKIASIIRLTKIGKSCNHLWIYTHSHEKHIWILFFFGISMFECCTHAPKSKLNFNRNPQKERSMENYVLSEFFMERKIFSKFKAPV